MITGSNKHEITLGACSESSLNSTIDNFRKKLSQKVKKRSKNVVNKEVHVPPELKRPPTHKSSQKKRVPSSTVRANYNSSKSLKVGKRNINR